MRTCRVDLHFSKYVGGANLPQPVPFVPSLPVPPSSSLPTPEEPSPEIVEPPRPGHFPFWGGNR